MWIVVLLHKRGHSLARFSVIRMERTLLFDQRLLALCLVVLALSACVWAAKAGIEVTPNSESGADLLAAIEYALRDLGYRQDHYVDEEGNRQSYVETQGQRETSFSIADSPDIVLHVLVDTSTGRVTLEFVEYMRRAFTPRAKSHYERLTKTLQELPGRPYVRVLFKHG